MHTAPIEIIRANLGDPSHCEGLLTVLSSYAEDPMGASGPLPGEVRERLVSELRSHPTTEILLAISDGSTVGIAICFVGFSTFRAKRLLNVHDLAVLPEHRARGVGRLLLTAAEERAGELDCCKLTLEVLDHNERARGLYESFGFGDFAPGASKTRTLFLEKML
jgi:ribosomal protein S18 acetylase RimI-like enzyme